MLKTEIFRPKPNENRDDFGRFAVEFMNWNKYLSDFLAYGLPVILWTAEPMTSHNTGMREKGESAKINGVWWKLKSWNTNDLLDEFKFRNEFLGVEASPFFTVSSVSKSQRPMFESKAESVGRLLSKALDAAIRAGWTPDQITSLVNTRIVITTMED